jgi:ABC-type nitrate/sulfonate/bicarbonate transport system substrate-binding protein
LGLALSGPSFLAPGAYAQTPPPNLGRIAYQLSFLKNFQFAGEYIADYRKYYQRLGLEVDLLTGGPGITVDPMVESGKALVGQSSPDFMSNAIAKGASLRCIGANYQKCLFCIISLAKAPLRNPQEMIGKKIGIETGNLVTWHAFLKLNHIDRSSLTTVPVQLDSEIPLISGEVDAYYGYRNDELVQIQAKGYDVHYFLLADYGYKMLNATYSVRIDSLTDKTKRAQLVAFMKGEVLGWQDAIKDPDLATDLTVNVYGKGNGLDPKTQKISCIITNDFMVSPTTREKGLFWMSPQSIQETITTLAAGGVKATPDMFTNEILEEAYEKNLT